MKNSPETGEPGPFSQGRRKLLATAATLGAFVPAATLSKELLSKSYPEFVHDEKDCEFSALANDLIYLNSGTEGSMPSCVLKALNSNLTRWASRPTDAYETDSVLGKHQHLNREHIAKSLSVHKNNVCITDNTTMGLNMVLMGLNFRRGDKVVLTNHEHNAILSPLAIQEEKLALNLVKRDFPTASKLANMTSRQLLDHLFPDTPQLRGARALCVSHVYPTTGTQLPLDLLREKATSLDIDYLVVDGAQGFGMLDISRGRNHISQADFYACPGHKWLNGPPSTGILYLGNDKIQPPEFYPTLSQRMGKYRPSEDGSRSTFPMAEALQIRGCMNTPGFAAMISAMEFSQQLGGPAAIQQHILALSDQVKAFVYAHSPDAMISPYRAPELQSGLTVFFPFSWKQPNRVFRTNKRLSGL